MKRTELLLQTQGGPSLCSACRSWSTCFFISDVSHDEPALETARGAGLGRGGGVPVPTSHPLLMLTMSLEFYLWLTVFVSINYTI